MAFSQAMRTKPGTHEQDGREQAEHHGIFFYIWI